MQNLDHLIALKDFDLDPDFDTVVGFDIEVGTEAEAEAETDFHNFSFLLRKDLIEEDD